MGVNYLVLKMHLMVKTLRIRLLGLHIKRVILSEVFCLVFKINYMKNLILLSNEELLSVNGGHEGIAYEAGVWLGKAVRAAAAIKDLFGK